MGSDLRQDIEGKDYKTDDPEREAHKVETN